ncbi:MAG TPA: vitamin K epoxide reductase family protein [Pyrinomonadaceae bacterium]|nr:vitamin K epoxide reductase family protein [Pyrinomonadaceae bacterium]
MTPSTDLDRSGRRLNWLPLVAALFALVGLIDAIYLTYHHYTAEPVPCSITGGCEMVLTSDYATIANIPIALFGAIAYADALLFAVLTATGRWRAWWLFGIQTTLMAAASAYLIYLQASVIHAFCQFCLLSAGTSIILFLIFLASLLTMRRSPA